MIATQEVNSGKGEEQKLNPTFNFVSGILKATDKNYLKLPKM